MLFLREKNIIYIYIIDNVNHHYYHHHITFKNSKNIIKILKLINLKKKLYINKCKLKIYLMI